MEQRFNLVDEPWVPIADVGRVSLRQVFSEQSYRALGGNPVQKIALTKLLLAIAQAAYTPRDDEDWAELGAEGMACHCLAYLDQWHDRFWLYGDRPFLQMPAISAASVQSFGAVLPEIATGNTTVLTQSHVERPLSDADSALLLVAQMGLSLGGKKTDNSVVLSPSYVGKSNDKGKPSTGKPGPSLGFQGYLHSFFQAENLSQSLWLNLLTHEQIGEIKTFPLGLGEAPWQQMPQGEACSQAQKIRNSLMGRLVPLARFCLLSEQGLHYSEGICHAGHKDGMADPSMAVDFNAKEPKALWVDPERRPWRQLTALLSFLEQGQQTRFDCVQLREGLGRARRQLPRFGIWCGGLRVSSNAGEQYVSGADDFVASEVMLESDWLGQWWYEHLSREMKALDLLNKHLYGATIGYFKAFRAEGEKHAKGASVQFWQIAEREFQSLVHACGDEDAASRLRLRKRFAAHAQRTYDDFCPKDSARQLDAWARRKPNLSKYLSGE